MNQDEVKKNLLSPAQWLRMLIMAGYFLALWVLGLGLLVVVLVQTLIALITGEVNTNLRRFGALCARYVQQIIAFLVYATDDKPFPFAPFPADSGTEGESVIPEDAPAGDTSAVYARPGPAAAAGPEPSYDPDRAPTDHELYGEDPEEGLGPRAGRQD